MKIKNCVFYENSRNTQQKKWKIVEIYKINNYFKMCEIKVCLFNLELVT